MLSDRHLPAMFHSADQASLKGQRDTVRWSAVQLLLLIVSAVLSATSFRIGAVLDLSSLLASLTLAASLLPTLWLASQKPQRQWYRGRAAAESVKMLAWKYSVRAQPFTSADAETDDEKFLRHLADILRNLRDLRWHSVPGGETEITARMRELRAAPLEVRRSAYLRCRIEDQYAWYTSNARRLGSMARRWTAATVLATSIGLVGGFLQAFGVFSFDMLGAASAMSAATTAWIQLKQFQPLASAYALTAHELLLVKTRLSGTTDESGWSRLCSEAEDAISREHTMWLAQRDV